jgi:hypothetical protein
MNDGQPEPNERDSEAPGAPDGADASAESNVPSASDALGASDVVGAPDAPVAPDGATTDDADGAPPVDLPVSDDDEASLDPSARSLQPPLDADDPTEAVDAERPSAGKSEGNGDVSDTAAVAEEEADEEQTAGTFRKLAYEAAAHSVVVELKRIEGEVRALLESGDNKRKRRLGGTRRWLELEDDILQWRYAGRFNEETLLELHRLVRRRHHLFGQLRFAALTRPVWNS